MRVVFRLVVIACVLLGAGSAWAQDSAPGLPSGGMELALLIVGLVLGVALTVLGRLAPITKNTIDDRALEILKQAAPTIEKWLDPTDPSVPPSPTNPTGRAQ